MDTKLTLKIDKNIVEEAKKYASSQKMSLSQIIESYLRFITTQKEPEDKEEIEISPFVKSMSSGKKIPTDIDVKSDYSKFLEEKYK
ncbi:MAG: DUF6364 family protein [Bacteroidales bacterium]|nr:DUF6364 family protein [Bacteroidales bacterium]